MRGFGLLALIACFLGAGSAGAMAGDLPHLRLFTSSQTPPKTYLDQGKATGYLVEISVEAMRLAGYEPEVEAIPWARAVAAAEAGEGVITAFSHTPDRDRLFEYSDVVFEDRVVLVTRRGADFPFESLKDLAGRTIGIQRGSSYGPSLEAALDTFNAVRDSGHVERLKMLVAGRIEGAIVSGGTPAVMFNASAAGIELRNLVIHSTPIAIDPNYMAIAKSRPDGAEVLGRINRAVEQMNRDGIIRKIIAAYEDDF
ncbi:MAG TPA: transporter substrate-binding domain-containing protein [Aliidongia sp.]|uniref:substrate-binding periplasmic protein n=1 Tax=Aliidongia sp. TaxID=1914230 RepID=UPI002DDD0849|nr:transporter substrate-binding domain-containing protein [Aliidongia sp.]HEV2675896.1 transporter substrate-binding domain-containing protein [Aliidongia sp.]